MGTTLNSYPDFIMKDKFDRIHIFEVKSVDKSSSILVDEKLYYAKVEELKKCYKQASKITNQIFYLPVTENGIWQITRFMNGEEDNLSEDKFREFIATDPAK